MAAMLPSKSRSGLSETSINKGRPSTPSSNHRPSTPSSNHRPSTPGGSNKSGGGGTPSTPRARKAAGIGPFKSEPNSPSPAQNARPRLSFDRSPRSVDSKPVVERRLPKIATPPDKQPRKLRGSESETELQAQLDAVQEDLKKAKEQLAFVEGEKDRVLGELNETRRLAHETNEKLQDALMAKRWAEEATEIEKFRADELEQAGIDETQKREEEWQREIESVRGQHATDLETLVSTTEELERVRRELAMANEAKNAALGHADDAMKIAEVNAEKVEILSGEVARLKALLDSSMESKESKDCEIEELVTKFESEMSDLKGELEKARAAEEKLVEMEISIEELRSEVADAKKAESDVHQLLEEWKEKAESLEIKLEEASLSEKFKTESLASAMKELEEIHFLLQDREYEIEALKGKMEALEIEVARHKADIDESNELFDASQQEVFELQTTIDVLKNKLEVADEATSEALNNEKIANAKIECLTEEKSKLTSELEAAKYREEKDKEAMEDLAAALREASTEAREAQERFLNRENDCERALAQIGDLKMALKNTKESYEVMLDEANYEIVCLRKTVKRLEVEVNNYREECRSKELDIVTSNKQSEEEITALKVEADKVLASLRGAEHEVQAAKEEKEQLQDKLMHVESAVAEANKAVEEAKAESLQLKERLLDKENALQSIIQENDDLRIREADAMKKIDELSALLAEATAKELQPEEDEKPVVVDREPSLMCEPADSVAENADAEGDDEKPKLELQAINETSNGDMNHQEENGKGNVEQEEQQVKVESTLQDNDKVLEKESPTEREQEAESADDELDSKKEVDSVDHANGTVSEDTSKVMMSPTKPQQQQQQQQQQKKNKPLLKKFGSLLKKKNSHK